MQHGRPEEKDSREAAVTGRMLSSSEACEWSVGPGLVEAVGTHDESNFSSDSPPD